MFAYYYHTHVGVNHKDDAVPIKNTEHLNCIYFIFPRVMVPETLIYHLSKFMYLYYFYAHCFSASAMS